MKNAPKYERYIEVAMKSAPADGPARKQFLRDLDKQIEMFEHEDACVNRMVCPGCGAALTKRVDPRQVGPVDLESEPGKWINYRCIAKCKWMGIDRKEPIGEN